MTFKKVKEFEYITIAEAKEVMEGIIEKRKEDSELLFETRRAMNNLRNFSKISADKAKELVEELMGLSFIDKRETAVKIVDIFPEIPDEIRTIFAKERFSISQEQIQEILEIIEKYR